jgi:hypothetical protein
VTSSSLASEIIYGSVEIWIFCAAEQPDALVWHHERDGSFGLSARGNGNSDAF